jgi:8-oxo-dGTP pyrophosphatase MutT (NUDIX family)
MSIRLTRYQGAIVQNHHILLIKHLEHKTGRTYWIFPGGGIEPGESEEECVIREMKEETNLIVTVTKLLFDQPAPAGDKTYQRIRTYLCKPLNNDAKPGYEPEPEASRIYGIVETRWFDLRSEKKWDTEVVNDPLTYLPLQRLREELGYLF